MLLPRVYGMFGVVEMGSGVSVVAVTKEQEIILVKEYNYALEEYLLETPSGGIEGHESPLEAAKRELWEEIGYVAKQWQELGMVQPLTMILKVPAYLFLATELEKTGEGEEEIEVVQFPFEKAYQEVMESKIVHAPSSVAILKAKVLLSKNSSS